MEGPDRHLVVGMPLDEKRDRFLPFPSAVLLDVPFRRADRRQKPLHLGLVVEDLAVEMARIPSQQHVSDVEYDGCRCMTHHQPPKKPRLDPVRASRYGSRRQGTGAGCPWAPARRKRAILEHFSVRWSRLTVKKCGMTNSKHFSVRWSRLTVKKCSMTKKRADSTKWGSGS